MSREAEYHIPVLLHEAVEALQVKEDGVYVDCTFGGGGHSEEILKKLGERGRLVAFDQDADARKNVPDDGRVLFVPHNFRHIHRFLRLHKIDQVQGVLADLGVSSHQFDEGERGFSTRAEQSELDMRMDRRQDKTAKEILRSYSELELHKMFEQYGEVTNAKTLARTITEARRTTRLDTIGDFKNLLSPIVKGNPNKYFAQVFQALRIEVNDEMGALTELLHQVPAVLSSKGRVAIITFHSIEDRIVKNFFKHGSPDENSEYDLYGTRKEIKVLVPVTKKPITPSEKETRTNPRARSAKLRVAEKQ